VDVEGAAEGTFAWSAAAGVEAPWPDEAVSEGAAASVATADESVGAEVLSEPVGAGESLDEGASLPEGGAEPWAGGGVKLAVSPKAGSG